MYGLLVFCDDFFFTHCRVVDFNNISRYLYILINEMQYESAPLIAGFILLVENSPHMKNQ